MTPGTAAPAVQTPVAVRTLWTQSPAPLCGSMPRFDAEDKVRGAAIYVADIHRPNLLHGKAVRSPHPHALVKAIDASSALAVPGVVAVFTAADFPGVNITGPRVFKDQPVLAVGRVRFAGEAVALVAAESEAIAERAARLVKVTYDLLPVVDDPARALEPGSPLVHENGNLCHSLRIVKGDYSAALLQADLVVTRTYHTPMGDHACMEPDGAVAEPDGDGIVVWDCTKGVHVDRGEVARVLGLPEDRVRVIAATIGGSFGSKPDLPTVCMAALIAWKTRRPARVVLSREEYFLVKTKRHPYTITMTHAVRRDGTLLGLKVDALADAGAYSSFTPSVLTRGLVHGTGPYRVPAVEMEVRAAFTNNPITGAFRGYGETQFAFALERQLDIIARELSLDPWELRMRNAMRPGDETCTGQRMDAAHMPEILEAGRIQAERLDAEDRAAGLLDDGPGFRRAWGIGAVFYGLGRTGPADKAEVHLRLTDEGLFHLFVGCPDTGQGSDTGLGQLAAHTLGLPVGLVRVTSADTKLTADSGTTTATRILYILGHAVVEAAASLRDRLLAVALQEEGAVRTSLPRDAAWLAALAASCRRRGVDTEAVGRFSTPTTNLDGNGQGSPYGIYTFGAQWTRVRVDLQTYHLAVERIVSCYDIGRVLNPLLVDGQVTGGTVMGLGFALTEEVLLDRSVMRNPNFGTYLLPSIADVPPITSIVLEYADPEGPYGAKGIGEPTAVPGGGSVANAVCAALGVEISELPLTPQRIYEAVNRSGGVSDPRGRSATR